MITESVIKAQGRVTVDEPAGGPSRAFPGVCVLPSGRWLCGFRGAITKDAVEGQSAYLTWSDDRGATWSAPAAPFQPPILDGRTGRLKRWNLYPHKLERSRPTPPPLPRE